MNRYCRGEGRGAAFWVALLITWCAMPGFLLTAFPSHALAASFTLHVEDHGGKPVSSFRWLVEQDTTHPVTPPPPGTPSVPSLSSLSYNFHTSHAPVVKQGEIIGAINGEVTIEGLDASKRYFVSVLPIAGPDPTSTSPLPIAYSNGGAQVSFGAARTTVVVARQPIPTAQISVFAYQDTQPINNAPDLPQEQGLADFDVKLFDAAGQYGAAGGRVFTDAFGNPLGTTYDASGAVVTMGNGTITTDANGVALIRNLAPGKYGVKITPPAGQSWVQTHTIEGSPTIDAWVKAGEPSYFTEFGPPGHHVFIGFVRPFDCFSAAASAPDGYCDGAAAPGGSTISGTIVNQHMSRPPDVAFYNAQPTPGCWIGLNSTALGIGRGNYAMPCNADSTFTIGNVPPGSYNLVVWDAPLDIIFTTLPVTVEAGSDVLLGEVSVFNWFHRMENTVFFDSDGNGFRDAGEPTLGADQAFVNLRFRDGRIYQSMPIDAEGAAPFDEVFPFFHWLVAEVSFGTLKATGMTATIDAGGNPNGEVLNPQPQFCTQADVDAGVECSVGSPLVGPGGDTSRTETGPVLTQAFQGFLGQTNRVEWGKKNYDPGENGGISGMVLYAITRAENDPRYAVGEEWEPGIPRVQVNLYKDCDLDGKPDQLADTATGCGALSSAGYVAQPPDVDNYPLGNFGTQEASEDVDHNSNGTFDLGDALRITHTDSFDDSRPSGCQWADPTKPYAVGTTPLDCFDGLRNFNQVRPGVFDGGYAFGGPTDPLAAGTYIVEVAVPPGYELVKEEDKNVDFGDTYKPAPLLLPNRCVGELHTIPPYLSMQTDATGTPYAHIAPEDRVAAPYANTTRPLCDRKQVRLSQGQNAASDFFLFTETPKAAMVVGGILNDLANEFDPNAPNFGEKFAPPWLPVSFRDWTGREIVRVYADENGKFNAMLPSTYSVHVPMPSGVSPNMLTACMNDAGPIPDPENPGQMMIDPRYDRRYSQFCYTFQYMPGGTTYLDTPVLPIAAFAGAGNPLDCEQPDGAPLIYSVTGPVYNGPLVNVGEHLTIKAVPYMDVPDPTSPDAGAITRRLYGFGTAKGTVTIGGVALTDVIWGDLEITGKVPPGAVTGQLVITRADGISAPSGVTVTVGPLPRGINVREVFPDSTPGATPIQNAIKVAGPNDLILLAPGSYDELVIMYKPVRLQGAGAYSTFINARKVPGEKLHDWRVKLGELLTANAFDLLPGQTPGFDPANNEPLLLNDGEGAGITVLGKSNGPQSNRFRAANNARIDGLTITGADHGGAIFVNGNANYLEISNNRLIANQGLFGGGIRVGHADLTTTTNNGEVYTDANNNNLNIHNNDVSQNGSLGGAGGGIALYTGADNYRVDANYICGNFTTGNGGGIGHLGLSTGGRITSNALLFNQSFNQGLPAHGGGITIAGQAPLVGTLLTPGSGSVVIDGNLIQGNQAGAGDGGGIALLQVNGSDVASTGNTNAWNRVDIFNNTVVNNVAGLAGGGVAMFDALKVNLIHNTVAHNDSTATAGAAFVNPSQSAPQPAGVVSRVNSTALRNALPPGNAFDNYREFSNPVLVNNIVWQNRSFYWSTTAEPGGADPFTFGLVLDTPAFKDLAVLGYAGQLNPQSCLLTDITGYASSNVMGDPARRIFVNGGFNGDRGQTILQPELTTAMQAQPALDEGGNFIEVRFGPLTPTGDYHLYIDPDLGSEARDAGNSAIVGSFIELTVDYDGEPRPQGTAPEIGSDEVAD